MHSLRARAFPPSNTSSVNGDPRSSMSHGVEALTFADDEKALALGNSTPHVVLATGPSKSQLAKLQAAGLTVLTSSGKPKPGKKGRKSGTNRNHDTAWSIVSMKPPGVSVPRNLDNQDYKVCAEADLGPVLTSSTTAFVGIALNFQASQVPNFADFTAVFDQYRIERIELWLMPASATDAGLASEASAFVSVIDYDDSNTPSSEAVLLDYQNSMVTSLNSGHYRAFIPHVALAAYSGAFTSFCNEEAPWIDAASPTVQHYGVKLGVTNTVASAQIMGRVRYWLGFRNAR